MSKPPRTFFAQATTTVSAEFMDHIELLFERAVDSIAARPLTPPPHHSRYAIPAYISATTAVETFINETFLSDFSAMLFGDATLILRDLPGLERMNLLAKLIVVPQLVFGKTLARGEQPYQDMKLLKQLRDELVHYKMLPKPPTCVRDLAQRGIVAAVPSEQEHGGPHAWPLRVSTVQGILWAYETVSATARAILALTSEMPQKQSLDFLHINFGRHHAELLRELAREHGIAMYEAREP